MSRETTYLERLEGYMTDEFHAGLLRVLEGMWGEVLHGDWRTPLDFFKSLRAQIGHVLRLRGKPLQLRTRSTTGATRQPGSTCSAWPSSVTRTTRRFRRGGIAEKWNSRAAPSPRYRQATVSELQLHRYSLL